MACLREIGNASFMTNVSERPITVALFTTLHSMSILHIMHFMREILHAYAEMSILHAAVPAHDGKAHEYVTAFLVARHV